MNNRDAKRLSLDAYFELEKTFSYKILEYRINRKIKKMAKLGYAYCYVDPLLTRDPVVEKVVNYFRRSGFKINDEFRYLIEIHWDE